MNHGTPFTGDGLRPVMPKTILAGFMSCTPAKPLPEDLETFIQESEHGVIFVSFGSVVKASKMPEAKRRAMLAVFSRLKQRVIWKWEEPMEDAPSNVLVSSWLPQTSLLAHPRVKLFITHGGAGSIQETVCHKTPIVGVPIGSDQFLNVAEVVGKGVGQQVGWHGMTEDSLHTAVTEVLGDSSYQEAVTRLRYSHPHNYKGTNNYLLSQRPDHGPGHAPAGEGGVVAGVPAAAPPQPRHEARHPRPPLDAVLPPGRHSRGPPRHHRPRCHHRQTSQMLLLLKET